MSGAMIDTDQAPLPGHAKARVPSAPDRFG